MSNGIPGNSGVNPFFGLKRQIDLDLTVQPTGLNGGNITQPYVLPTADLANSQSFVNAIMIQANNLLDNLALNGLLANRMLAKAASLDKASEEDTQASDTMSAAVVQLATACVSSAVQIVGSSISLGDSLGSANDQAKSIQMKADVTAAQPMMNADGIPMLDAAGNPMLNVGGAPMSAADATKQANLLDVQAKRLDAYADNIKQVWGEAAPKALDAPGGVGVAAFNSEKLLSQARGDRYQAYATQASANADDYSTQKKKLDDNKKAIIEYIKTMEDSVVDEMKATTTA